MKSTSSVSVVVPNWNGEDELPACLDSLRAQSLKHRIIVVENGSTDGSLTLLQQHYPDVEIIIHDVNKGFAGGVNAGIRKSISDGDVFVALFNNDAIADKNWLEALVKHMETYPEAGIATCKLINAAKDRIDSTGEVYTIWGLPYPRGRGEPVSAAYDKQIDIFGASGGASIYRVSMLQEIGLFDEDFFAYYEDVDISFRAQLAGWKVAFVPKSITYHRIGATSSKLKGFTTYQTIKNLPLVVFKNVPRKFLFRVGVRYFTAHMLFFCSAVARGQGLTALRADARSTRLLFKNISVRRHIQKSRKVSDDYIWSLLVHELPPNAHRLRKFFHR